MFPYFSEEARSQLGLPDSPVLHHTITNLADRLMPFAKESKHELRIVRISALRTASRAALEELPFEWVLFLFCTGLDLSCDRQAAEAAYRTTRTDWLALSVATIRATGMDLGPETSRMATPYGWNAAQSERADISANAKPMASEVDRTVVDELGRTWVLPEGVAGLKELLNSYGRAMDHRPSDAVMAAFRRHPGRMNTLWMLVMRGAEGERLNLAARALAIGPIPPLRQVPGPPPDGVTRPVDFLHRRWAANDERDRQLVEALRAEAEDSRTAGHTD